MRKLTRVISISIALIILMLSFSVSAAPSWSGNYTENTPEAGTTKVALGKTDGRNTATYSGFETPVSNYELTYKITYDRSSGGLATDESGDHYFPQIKMSNGDTITTFFDNAGMCFKVNGVKISDFAAVLGEEYTFVYTFYRNSNTFSMKVNNQPVKDSNQNEFFSVNCSGLDSLYFYRELQKGITVINYIRDIAVNSVVLTSVQSNVYTVDENAFTISGVPRNTGYDEFLSNLIVSDALCKVVNQNGTQKTSGLIEDGDKFILYDGAGSFNYEYQIQLAGFTLTADFYNIDNTELIIRGVDKTFTCLDFFGSINLEGNVTKSVVRGDTALNDSDVIKNDDVLVIKEGENETRYTLKTTEATNYYYMDFDFNDGKKDGWSGSAQVVSDSTNSENKVLSAEFPSGNGYDVSYTINNSRDSDFIVCEFDIKYPDYTLYPYNINGPYLDNTGNDANGKPIIMSVRAYSGNLATLNGPTQEVVAENITGSWKNIKMVSNTAKKTFDIYIDNKVIKQGMQFQATTDFKAGKFRISIPGASAGTLELDNVKVYEPLPLLMSVITSKTNGIQSYDINSISSDVDEVSIKFESSDSISIDTENALNLIGIYDTNNREIKTEKSYEPTTKTFTFKIKEMLDFDSKYFIRTTGLKDDYYGKQHFNEVPFYTRKPDGEVSDSGYSYNSSEKKLTLRVKNNTGNLLNTEVITVLYDNNGNVVGVGTNECDIAGYAMPECVITYNDIISTPKKALIYLKQAGGGLMDTPTDISLN